MNCGIIPGAGPDRNRESRVIQQAVMQLKIVCRGAEVGPEMAGYFNSIYGNPGPDHLLIKIDDIVKTMLRNISKNQRINDVNPGKGQQPISGIRA